MGYRPQIPNVAYAEGEGPVVCVDETHNNFHTSVGTYRPFADVLRRDGYVVERFTQGSEADLAGCGILVIAVAQPPNSVGEPPTFSTDDVQRLRGWVAAGGSLLLITDHQPDPGAIAGLAASFDVEVHNGYVLNGPPGQEAGPLIFTAEDGGLRDDPLLRGRGAGDEVSQVATFTGAALRGGEDFRALLVLRDGLLSWAPHELYEFRDDSPRVDVSGWSQGGVMDFGSGRLAVFGEAAMFTAQVFDRGNVRVGMNADVSVDNLALLLNVMHWLSRLEGLDP
jgi:hypothetical protein